MQYKLTKETNAKAKNALYEVFTNFGKFYGWCTQRQQACTRDEIKTLYSKCKDGKPLAENQIIKLACFVDKVDHETHDVIIKQYHDKKSTKEG